MPYSEYMAVKTMEKVYHICCGIDVHKKLIVACLRKNNKSELREFGATTKELLKLADWLNESGCEMAAMESTGSYWKPLYNVLESSEIKAIVVNAQHMKAVPGRMDCGFAAAWASESKLHSVKRATGTARTDTLPKKFGRGTEPRTEQIAENAGRSKYKVIWNSISN